jgi:hypothetical protein
VASGRSQRPARHWCPFGQQCPSEDTSPGSHAGLERTAAPALPVAGAGRGRGAGRGGRVSATLAAVCGGAGALETLARGEAEVSGRGAGSFDPSAASLATTGMAASLATTGMAASLATTGMAVAATATPLGATAKPVGLPSVPSRLRSATEPPTSAKTPSAP